MSSTSRRGRPPHPDILTPAEWQVLEGVRAGRTNQEIAEDLGITFHTVKYHVSNMLSKLGLEDRRALAAWRPDPETKGRGWSVRLAVPWPLLKAAGAAAGCAAVLGVTVAVLVMRGPDDDPSAAVLDGGDESPEPTTEVTTATPALPTRIVDFTASSPPARNVPDSTVDTQATILLRGNAFTRFSIQVELSSPVPGGAAISPVDLRVSAYGPEGDPVPVEVRLAPAIAGGIGGTLVILTVDTAGLPRDTTHAVVEWAGFRVFNLSRPDEVLGDKIGPFRGSVTIADAPELAEDLSDRVPGRIDTGFGWSYVIDGVDRDESRGVWVTYHAEGAIRGLGTDLAAGGTNVLPFNGTLVRTEAILAPQGQNSVTVRFGGARQASNPSELESAPLQSGDWTITIPLE